MFSISYKRTNLRNLFKRLDNFNCFMLSLNYIERGNKSKGFSHSVHIVSNKRRNRKDIMYILENRAYKSKLDRLKGV